MKRALITGMASLAIVAIPATNAEAKSTGVCPPSGVYQLVTVESLEIDPVIATGLPSLDGTGDGMTCIKPLPNGSGLIFRDNTVQASS